MLNLPDTIETWGEIAEWIASPAFQDAPEAEQQDFIRRLALAFRTEARRNPRSPELAGADFMVGLMLKYHVSLEEGAHEDEGRYLSARQRSRKQ